MHLSRLSRALLVLALPSGPALAQCEVDWLDPLAGPLTSKGSLSQGVAVLGGWNNEVTVFEPGSPQGWIETGTFVAPGFQPFWELVVANWGHTILAGVREAEDDEGRVYVYEGVGAAPVTLVGGDTVLYDAFGAGVAIHDDTIVVGASMQTLSRGIGPGKAYVFERVGSSWVETARFTPHGHTSVPTLYGFTISTDGQTAAIGAAYDDEQGVRAGAAYIYERGPNGWQEVSKVFASTPAGDDLFGQTVSVEGDVLMVGSRAKVHVLERLPGGWVVTQILTTPSSNSDDRFGASVSLSGNRALIGAPSTHGDGTFVGAVYAFRRGPTGWQEDSGFIANDAPDNTQFGTTVVLERSLALWIGYADYARLNSLGVGLAANYCSVPSNSSGAASALSASGCDSVSGNALVLSADGVPAGKLGLFAMSAQSGQTPFWNGSLCLSFPIYRLPFTSADASGVMSIPVDLATAPTNMIAPFQTWYFQAFFRDAGGVAMSDGIAVQFQL